MTLDDLQKIIEERTRLKDPYDYPHIRFAKYEAHAIFSSFRFEWKDGEAIEPEQLQKDIKFMTAMGILADKMMAVLKAAEHNVKVLKILDQLMKENDQFVKVTVNEQEYSLNFLDQIQSAVEELKEAMRDLDC